MFEILILLVLVYACVTFWQIGCAMYNYATTKPKQFFTLLGISLLLGSLLPFWVISVATQSIAKT